MDDAGQHLSGGIVSELLALAESQNLRRRADEMCKVWLRSANEEGELCGWSIEEIELHFERCSLVFEHGILSYPFVETRLGLYVADTTGVFFRGLRPIGHYRLITLLDGTDNDDYFVLDTFKHAEPEVAPDCGGIT